jgi:peroxiredoxin
MSVTIAEQVAVLRASMATRPPNDAMDTFDQEQAELAKGGIPAAVAAPGSVLRDAAMLDAEGTPIRLYQAIGHRPAVLVFYRGAWCPYCNIALRTYQRELAGQLAARGVALVAISPQKPDGARTMVEKNELTFTVLSNPGNALARTLGIITTPSPDARAAQLEGGLDIAAGNSDGTPRVPMPTTVVVGADRVIRWIDVHPDYTTRSEPSEILAALDSVNDDEG